MSTQELSTSQKQTDKVLLGDGDSYRKWSSLDDNNKSRMSVEGEQLEDRMRRHFFPSSAGRADTSHRRTTK